MSIPRHRRYPLLRPKKGRCRFCGEGCEPHRTWHDGCGEMYNDITIVRRTRRMLADRDGPFCRICGSGNGDLMTDGALVFFEVDHIVPLAVGDGWPPERRRELFMPGNLQLLCHSCHARKTAEDRRLIREMRRRNGRCSTVCTTTAERSSAT